MNLQVKCAQYWPQREERDRVFKDTNLKLTLVSEDVKSYYTVRQLELENLSVSVWMMLLGEEPHQLQSSRGAAALAPSSPCSNVNVCLCSADRRDPGDSTLPLHHLARLRRAGVSRLLPELLVQGARVGLSEF